MPQILYFFCGFDLGCFGRYFIPHAATQIMGSINEKCGTENVDNMMYVLLIIMLADPYTKVYGWHSSIMVAVIFYRT